VKTKKEFTVIIHPEEGGGFYAEVPALDGCLSQGRTLEEVKKNIIEAIELCLMDEAPIISEVFTEQVCVYA
jgi:predicted RNase H-like HicB family nuclease